MVRKLAHAIFVRFLGAVSAVGLNVAVTRSVCDATAGSFLSWLSMVHVLSAFSRLGIDNFVVRQVSKAIESDDEDAYPELLGSSIVIVGVGGILTWIVLIGAWMWNRCGGVVPEVEQLALLLVCITTFSINVLIAQLLLGASRPTAGLLIKTILFNLVAILAVLGHSFITNQARDWSDTAVLSICRTDSRWNSRASHTLATENAHMASV